MTKPPAQPRVVFMGSPEFSVPSLQALSAHYKVVGVVTQPDRPAGRGQTLTPPPVKALALQLGLPSIQPQKLRLPEAMQQLRDWKPDLIVVTAFGQILRPEVLDLPAYGCVNVHASLLPRWRGAAPINAAILHGDPQSGVTIMRMEAGVDTGPLISQRAIAIQPGETAAGLAERLAALGADLLVETLPGYLSGELAPQPQDEDAGYLRRDAKKRRRRAGFQAQRGGAGAQSARFPALARRLYLLAGWTAESATGALCDRPTSGGRSVPRRTCHLPGLASHLHGAGLAGAGRASTGWKEAPGRQNILTRS